MPDLESLRLLVLVGELGSLGQAAERLGISQPAASKRLSLLERRLRLALVDRGTRGSRLTLEGRAVCQWSDRVLAEVDSLMVGVSALRGDRDNDLRVASSMTLAEHFVPGWIGTLRRRSPEVHVSMKVTNSEQVAVLTGRGQVGIGFLEAPTVPRGLTARKVAADRLAVVVAPTHPWARRRTPVALDELAGTPLIVREPGSGTREALDRILSGATEQPVRPLMVLDANAAIRGAVLADVGPAMLSAVTVRTELTEGLLVEVPVTGANLHRTLHAVWPEGRKLVGPAEDLLHVALRAGRPRPSANIAETDPGAL